MTPPLPIPDALRSIADSWGLLDALVAGGRGRALTGMPTGGDTDTIPIDTTIVDLMTDVEHKLVWHYTRLILDEVPVRHGCGVECAKAKPPRTAEECPQRVYPMTDDSIPGLLRQLADRYGHFLNHPWEDRFAKDVADYHKKVRRACAPPAPPIYLGPCPGKGPDGDGCPGELYLRDDRNTGRCAHCGTPFDRASHEAWLADQMADRLLTITEIGRALTTLGTPVPPGTLRRWASTGVLERHDDDLYRLHDAHQRALARHVKGSAA